MSASEAKQRVVKSIENLMRSGGRVISVRLTPKSNQVIKAMMEENPALRITDCVNKALECYEGKKQYVE